MKELKKTLDKGLEALKDFNSFKHLFSEDDAERQLAELRRTIGEIVFHLKLSEIKEVGFPQNKALQPSIRKDKTGLVKVRPCGDKYKDKTYVGFYIGDIALGSSVLIEDEKIVCNFSQYNPAIYVPDLNRVIYGCESWWQKIDSPEDLKEITDDDIQNVWYVKLLKDMNEEEKTVTSNSDD